MSNRHLARTIVMQTLYEWDFRKMPLSDVEALIKENIRQFAPNFEENGYIEKTVTGVLEHQADIDAQIIKYAPEWPLEQITGVDRNILRVGIFELVYSDQIPAKVAINEAIELGKTFGGDASGRFVNGVLGSIYRDLPQELKQPKKEDKPEKEAAAEAEVPTADVMPADAEEESAPAA